MFVATVYIRLRFVLIKEIMF